MCFEKKLLFVGHEKDSFLIWVKCFHLEINRCVPVLFLMFHLPSDLNGLLFGFIPHEIIFAPLLFGQVFNPFCGGSRQRVENSLSKLPIGVWEDLSEYRKHRLAKIC